MIKVKPLLIALIAGLLIPLGFAPFNMPGLIIAGIATLYYQINNYNFKATLLYSFAFGIGFFGLGVSWIIISVHDYGHLNWILSGLITLLLVSYLSLFMLSMTICYKLFYRQHQNLFNLTLFSCLWVLFEWLRATLLTGFPWLLIGYSQINTPLKHLAPIIGVYGLSFFTVLAACLLSTTLFTDKKSHSFFYLAAVALVFLIPAGIKTNWTKLSDERLKVGIVQTNLSMRDKWDPTLFWKLVDIYRKQTKQMIFKQDIILWPESSLPVAYEYLKEIFSELEQLANQSNTALLIGIPSINDDKKQTYYNAIIAIGDAKGRYFKQHLVPFGEYIPGSQLQFIFERLQLPLPNMIPGPKPTHLMQVKNHKVASLICYEIAYPELLRTQAPNADYIISLSDDGWFGHSFALAQHLQMARMLSLLVGRYQIVANNNGLSSIIDNNGNIQTSLPPFVSDKLQSTIIPVTGYTPWMHVGDTTIIGVILVLIFIMSVYSITKGIAERKKREYP
jgi:apolipoprotein N-acyltransferase